MLDAVVRAASPGMSWGRARTLVRRGKVTVDGVVTTEITGRVPPGARVEVNPAAPRLHAAGLAADAIVYVDADVIVIDKPAGFLTVPYQDERDTLVERAERAIARMPGGRRGKLGVVQRLDKDTSGLIVFTRTLEAKRVLQGDLRKHAIERRYLAIVHGLLSASRRVDTVFVPDRGDGLKGTFGRFRRARGGPPPGSQRAVTDVRPIELLKGATLIECELETGKQHQIRIHLAELGHPIVGETVYVRDYRGPRIEAPRQMLHAAVLAFLHPRTAKPMRFERDPPADFRAVLARLGRKAG